MGLHSTSVASLQSSNATINASVLAVQNEVANMKTSAPGGTRHQTVLDSKSVQNIKQFGGDKSMFRTWNDKFINVFTQVRQIQGAYLMPCVAM